MMREESDDGGKVCRRRGGQVFREPGELGAEGLRRLGTGQAAELDRGTAAVSAGSGAHEHAAAADQERHEQPGQRRDGGEQRGKLPGVIGDGQADPLPVAGEGERAHPVRQLHRLPGGQRPRGDRQPVHAPGVQLVDRLRRAAVHAEVARVGDQAHRWPVRRGEGRLQLPAHVHGGRQEHPGEAKLLGTGVRDLDHALGGEAVQRDRDERHRPVEYHVTGPVGDPEHRGVPVADQVHLHVVHVQRVVHLEVVVLRRRARLRLVAEVGVERGRLSGVRPRGHVARVERVECDAERLQVRRRDQPPGAELIERGHRIAKRLASYQKPVRLVAEQTAQADRDQQGQQREMEQQVAGLAQVALFRRDPAVPGAHPEPLARQQRRRLGERGVRGERGGHRDRQRQPGQVARGPGRLLARGAGQPERPRYHASGEGEEQQQVDRREPGRREHVEQ